MRSTVAAAILAALLTLTLAGCRWSYDGDLKPLRPGTGRLGMVSCAHPLATEAGLKILRAGGNAFDAAVAVAAALNVTEPMMSGMGGYGTILIYTAQEKRLRFLDSSGRIPVAVNSDVYRAPTPGYLQNRRGAKAVSTPGNVAAWEAMLSEYGTLGFTEVLAPAIALAEEGFLIDKRIAQQIDGAYRSFPPHARAIYGRDGRALRAGETLVQHDLARSLRSVAKLGAAALYGGPIGIAIDAGMREAGGFLSIADLQAHKAEWWEPIHIVYRGFQVYVPPPPANSFPALVRLGMMSRYEKGAMRHNSPDYLHRFAEVTKHAFWTRLRWAGDPDVAPPPLATLLSEKYWADQVAKIDDSASRPFVPPRKFSSDGDNTTHFVVADQFGNVVSATQTLGRAFGSRIMPKGTGIWMNNSLAYCTFEPKGNPMDAHAGRRKLSGDAPAIVLRDGRPWIALGTPGGHTIAQIVPQMLMNIIDFGMDVAAAVDATRVSFFEPNGLGVERLVPYLVREELKKRGHKLVEVRGLGNAHALSIEYDAAGKPVRFRGAADRRGTGRAEGY